MGKYANHEELGANAPVNWRENTRPELYLEGMSTITPPGMKLKAERVNRFKAKIDQPHSTRWHLNYDVAMFGGTDIPGPSSETKQMRLEEMLDHIPRKK